MSPRRFCLFLFTAACLVQLVRGDDAKIFVHRVAPAPEDVGFASPKNTGPTREDYTRIKRLIGMRGQAIPIRQVKLSLRSTPDDWFNAPIVGTTEALAEVSTIKIAHGRYLTVDDVNDRNNVVVLGLGAAVVLFGRADVVGEVVRIGDQAFLVVGVSAKATSYAWIPITTMTSRFGDFVVTRGEGSFRTALYQLTQIIVSVHEADDLDECAALVRRILRTNHEEEEDYTIAVGP